MSNYNEPENENEMLSMENEELNPNLINLVQVAQEQRQENIMNVIRHNDFNAGYKTNAQFKVLKNASEDRLGIDYETQLNILIASEEDADLREKLSIYCDSSRLHQDFDEEKLVEDILCGNFSFL